MTLLSARTPAPAANDTRPPAPVVEVQDLSVTFRTRARHVEAVRGISFAVQPGQILAIVGESGSGKSVTARTLVGLAGDGAEVTATRLNIAGHDARGLSDAKWRALRGSTVGLVLQDALTSLDPLRTVGNEVGEVLRVKRLATRKERPGAVQRHLEDAGMPEAALRAQQYPHELSGGLRQRALIASGLAGSPDLLIADEPTTALDVTVQAQILDLLALKRAEGTAILLISHDLAVVSQIADEVLVMNQGLVVESGRTAEVLGDPQHEVTRGLLEAIPSARSRGRRLIVGSGSSPAPRTDGWRSATTVLEARGVSRDFDLPGGGVRHAVAGVNLAVRQGQKLGIVGESGSGKSTLARLLLGLLPVTAGEVTLDGKSWNSTSGRERLNLRRSIQFVSQDPHGSFDPRYTVGEVIAEPLRGSATRTETDSRITELLELVHLDPSLAGIYPRTLSGGQRQRVSIARALALRPEIIVADEPVSALDVSIQAQILDLFSELVETTDTALVFISHDLGVVHHLVDTVAVMHDGRIVEEGDVEEVFSDPQHPYTRSLLAAIPALPLGPAKGAS